MREAQSRMDGAGVSLTPKPEKTPFFALVRVIEAWSESAPPSVPRSQSAAVHPCSATASTMPTLSTLLIVRSSMLVSSLSAQSTKELIGRRAIQATIELC